jgi:hypothetical protein
METDRAAGPSESLTAEPGNRTRNNENLLAV